MSIWQWFSLLTLDLFFWGSTCFYVSSPENQPTNRPTDNPCTPRSTCVGLMCFGANTTEMSIAPSFLRLNGCLSKGWTNGWKGVYSGGFDWDLGSWWFFFFFLLLKMTAYWFFPGSQKKGGPKKKGRHPSFEMGHALFHLKQYSDKIWKFLTARQKIIMKSCLKNRKATMHESPSKTHQSLLDSAVWNFQTRPTESWDSIPLPRTPKEVPFDPQVFFGADLFWTKDSWHSDVKKWRCQYIRPWLNTVPVEIAKAISTGSLSVLFIKINRLWKFSSIQQKYIKIIGFPMSSIQDRWFSHLFWANLPQPLHAKPTHRQDHPRIGTSGIRCKVSELWKWRKALFTRSRIWGRTRFRCSG